MKCFLISIMIGILTVNVGWAAQNKIFSAAGFTRLLDSSSNGSDGGISADSETLDTLGVFVTAQNKASGFYYRLDQIPDQMNIKKIVVYAKNTDKISSAYIMNLILLRITKLGVTDKKLSFMVPTGADSSYQKIAFNVSDFKMNSEKYDYALVVRLGDWNTELPDSDDNALPEDVPIFNAVKVVYK